MKKLSSREKKLVGGLLGFLVIYILYVYVVQPLNIKKDEYLAELQILETKKENKSIFEEKLRNIEQKNEKAMRELDYLLKENNVNPLEYQELLTTLGYLEENHDIDVTDFKKMSSEENKNYTKMPFEVVIQGSYINIVKFMNSFYGLDNYFVIEAIELKEIELIPMTDKVVNSGSSNSQEHLGFDWADGLIEKLNKKIPTELLNEQELDEELKQFEEMLRMERKENSVIQLRFRFYFLLINNK